MTRATAYQHLQTTILRGGRVTKTTRAVVSFAPPVVAGCVLLAAGGALGADDKYGPSVGPNATILCDAATFTVGPDAEISYTNLDGVTILGNAGKNSRVRKAI